MRRTRQLQVFFHLLISCLFAWPANSSAQNSEMNGVVNTRYFSSLHPWALIPGSGEQTAFAKHPEYGVLPWNAPCTNCYEDLSKRTEYSRYFVLSSQNGVQEYSLQQAYGALHYKDAAGNWVSFDKRLHQENPKLFRLRDREFAVEIDLDRQVCTIQNGNDVLSLNGKLELIAERQNGSLLNLGKANWSDFSAGDQGVYIKNCWPGIDMQMISYRGAIKTNFIIQKPLGEAYRSIRFLDQLDFSGSIRNQGTVYASTEPVELCNAAGETLFNLGVLAVYDQNTDQAQNGLEFPFEIQGNTIEMKIPGEWLNNPARAYPLVIDPLVSASNTTLRASILGSKYDATCWNAYCAYDMDVPVPPNSTITDALFSMTFRATSPCVLKNGAMRFTSGSCVSPGNGFWWNCNNIFTGNSPGTCEGLNYSFFSDLGTCFPAPQCGNYTIPFQFQFFRCYDSRPGCSGECIGAEIDWKVEIRGRTVEPHASRPIPLPPVTQSICEGASANLGVEGAYGIGPYTYSWSPGGMSGPNAVVSPVNNTTYSVIITDACGITANKNFNIVVTKSNNPDFTIAPNPTCINTPITFTGGGNGAITAYDWTLPGSTNPVVANLKTLTAQYSSPGTYDVTLNYQQGTCTFPLVHQVEVLAPGSGPGVSITSDPPMPVCTGALVTYTAIPQNAGASPTFQWKLNGIPVGGNSDTYSSSSLTATDVLTVTVTANMPCITPNTGSSAPFNISIAPPTTPSVNISMNPAGAVCPGSPISFTATPSQAGSNPTYQWMLNNVPTGTGGSTFTSSSLAQGDRVSVVLTSNSPCSTTPTANSSPITVNLLPEKIPAVSLAVSPAGPVCTGTALTFTASPTNGGSSPIYTWKLNGVVVPAVSGNTFSSSTLQNNDEVLVELLSNETCPGPNPLVQSNAIKVAVLSTVLPAITIQATPGIIICSGSPVTFKASSDNGGTAPAYQWLINGTPVSGQTGLEWTSTTLNDGDVISIRMVSNAQCAEPATVISQTLSMEVMPTLTGTANISAMQAMPICDGAPLDVSATFSNVGPNPSFTWLVNDAPQTETSATLHLPNPANGELVQLRIVPDGPCFTASQVLTNILALEVLPNLAPSVSIEATPSDTVCKNSYQMQFMALAENGGPNPSYRWFLNASPDGPDSPSYTNPWIKEGDRVEVEMISTYQCKTNPDAKSNAIEVKGYGPISVNAGMNQEICRDDQVTLNAEAVGGKSGLKTYLWTPGNLSGNPIPQKPLQSTTYRVEVTDQCGSFFAYDSVLVTVHPKPNVHFSWSPLEPILMLTPEITLSNPNTIPVTRFWEFGDGTTSVDAEPTHVYSSKGTYTIQLLVTSDKGCKDTRSAQINVKDVFVFYIPNSFTPNGDGVNDSFQFFFNDSIPFTMQIFNRWGQMVYSGNEQSPFWDGKDVSSGKYVQDDIYVYKLVYRKKGIYGEEPRITLHGNIAVVKHNSN